ncbi:hypothetical protein RND71_038127 [Anisodus tanguticus]|uniref:Uncharacterized protein n=1 Tax=Anisodus tanguticus TaxID=243964 RepID=A0AAE1UWQ2_9SOLA|nr:hypothetical protein RND71_038127 [Anisodus tanguticus]
MHLWVLLLVLARLSVIRRVLLSNKLRKLWPRKAQGADYAYLLEEANAQFQYSSENVSLYDDVLDARVKQQKDSNSLTSTSVHESNKNTHQPSEFSHLATKTSSSRHPTLADESSNPSNISKDEAGQSEGSGQNDMFASEFNTSSVSKKPSAFKAAATEAELDMLLDSVTEIDIFESKNVIEAGTPTPLSEGTSSKSEVSTQAKKGHDVAKPAISDISLDFGRCTG